MTLNSGVTETYAAEDIRTYVSWQGTDEVVNAVERVATKHVLSERYTIWDVRTDQRRWWVIEPLTNLYAQEDYPSMEVAFTYHLGVIQVLSDRGGDSRDDDGRAERLAATFRRIQQSGQALDEAEEAEDLQAVGVRLREALKSLSRQLEAALELSPADAPKAGDFLGWALTFADRTAPGKSNERLRSYLKNTARVTWELVNWLTHAENATRHDAEIALNATDNVVTSFLYGIVRSAMALSDVRGALPTGCASGIAVGSPAVRVTT